MDEELTQMNITEAQHKDLISVFDELISTMESMEWSYFLSTNIREAKDWRDFLIAHTDKEELMSLNKEIAERFVHKYEAIDHEYDVKFGCFDLDHKRLDLMEEFLGNLWRYIS